VVATGGDTVELRDKVLLVNGHAVEDSRAVHADPQIYPRGVSNPGLPGSLGNRDNWGPYRIPEGQVFLMGDNRDFSADSRFFGPVPERNVIGRARLVAFSYDPRKDGSAPWKHVRLDRLGRVLN
jgi:signal peptidase I